VIVNLESAGSPPGSGTPGLGGRFVLKIVDKKVGLCRLESIIERSFRTVYIIRAAKIIPDSI